MGLSHNTNCLDITLYLSPTPIEEDNPNLNNIRQEANSLTAFQVIYVLVCVGKWAAW